MGYFFTVVVFLEILWHLLSFDLGWLFVFMMNNLLWVFAFLALAFFVAGGKNFVYAGLLIFLSIALVDSFAFLSGWVFLVGGFLLLNYMAKISFLNFVESNAEMSGSLVLWNEVFAFGFFILFNVALLLGWIRI
ncbi:MAG: hypothetical protein HY394_05965 [Candidatus Diapherotrites archaeon]|nr:hypothetical protein [Candidatus Diapherotrites archaeon]